MPKYDNKTMTDEEIIDMYWRRNENAIRETDKKYGKLLFQTAFHILRDRLDSEECQNDAYFAVWKKIPPTRPTAFLAFLLKILRRITINRYKEKMRKKRIPSEFTVSMDDLSEVLTESRFCDSEWGAEMLGKIISDYLKTLGDRQQYIFIGHFYMGTPAERIAAELSVSSATVYRDMEKIKSGLKTYLDEKGGWT